MLPSEPDWLSMLRPSAISALVRLRKRLAEAPDLTPSDARKMLLASYTNSGFDFESAIRLHGFLSPSINEPKALFRATITLVINRGAPPWASLLRLGRDTIKTLDPDTVACFDRAGAFVEAPESDMLGWWDELANQAYASRNLDLCILGRDAERRSLDYEYKRLQGVQGASPPIWKALDNNLVGYDIQSTMLNGGALVPKLIEVKGSTRQPISFHVTRNEWETAARHRLTYFFHIWHLDTNHMTELTVSEVESHIPHDQGRGQWREVLIELPNG